jgi:hypothetical protein
MGHHNENVNAEHGKDSKNGNAGGAFVVTNEWQEVPKDAVLPPGCQIENNITTGAQRVRRADRSGSGDGGITPNAAHMRQHLEYLFGSHLNGCRDGRIELAWNDPKPDDTGKYPLKHAVSFGTGELDKLVARAVQVNSIPNQNVYIGIALRRPDFNGGRASKADFLALTDAYSDQDDPGTTEAAYAVCKQNQCLPSATVVTGHHPYPRAQFLWRLTSPEHDPERCEALAEAIATFLHGDPSVKNCDRLLRLAGSIAWPIKGGDRIKELTQLRLAPTLRAYSIDEIERAFPRISKKHRANGETEADDLNIGLKGPLKVKDLMAKIKAGHNWDDNMLRLIGHWIWRGWSDEEILATAPFFTLRVYTIDQTIKEMRDKIKRGREKWKQRNPDIVIDDEEDMEPGWVVGSAIQPKNVDWLWEDRFVANRVNLIAGLGDVGKDVFCCSVAACVTTGKPWPDGRPGCEPGIVGIYSPEDEADDTIVPRLLAAGADMSRIRIWTKSRKPRPEELDGLKVFIISPLINLLDGKKDINREQDVRAFLELIRRTAKELRCTVIGTAHFNKKSDAPVAARVLGATGFLAFLRSGWSIQRDDEDISLRLFMRLKANLSPDGVVGIRFTIEHAGQWTQCIRCVWQGETDKTPDEVMGAATGGKERKQTAKEWLLAFLHIGKEFSREEVIKAAEDAGHKEQRISNVFNELIYDGVAKSRIDGFPAKAHWTRLK